MPTKGGPQHTKPSQDPEVQLTIEHVSDEDRAVLERLVGATITNQLIEMDQAIQKKQSIRTAIKFPALNDRQKRGAVHQVC